MSDVVPDGWSEDYISEYFDFFVGGTPSRNNELYWDANQTTSNIWVSIRDLKNKFISNSAERISELGVSKSNVKLLPKGTVLMSFKLSIGQLSISMIPLYTNEAIVGFIEKRPNRVDRDYLYYGLQSWNLLGEVDQAIKGATLNKDKMSRIIGIFPPLPEQKKIASILTSVDEVIENTQKQIDKLQDLKKATINELLTKGIGHTEFKDSELGRIPKSWTINNLKKFCKKVDKKYYGDNYIPVLSVTKYAGFVNSLEYFKKQVFSKDLHSYKLVAKGQFAYATIHLDEGSLGLLKKYDFGLISPMYTVFETSDDINNDYLFMLMKSDIFMKKYQIIGQGSIDRRMTISFDNLSQLIMFFPTLKEQNEIVKIINQIDKNINLHIKKINQTQSLKKSLMQDLLTGKVRISVN